MAAGRIRKLLVGGMAGICVTTFFSRAAFCEEVLSPSNPFEGDKTPTKPLGEGIILSKTKTGLLLTDNRAGNNYSLSIPCKTCRTLGDSSKQILIEADGNVIQALIVPISEFIPDRDITSMPDEKILQAQMEYEVGYLASAFHKPMGKPETQNIPISADSKKSPEKKALLWGISFPKGVSKFYMQMYATYRLGDRVLVLMGAVHKKTEESEVKQRLQEIMASLKLS